MSGARRLANPFQPGSKFLLIECGLTVRGRPARAVQSGELQITFAQSGLCVLIAKAALGQWRELGNRFPAIALLLENKAVPIGAASKMRSPEGQ